MFSIRRRVPMVLLGLAMGWYAAGVLPGLSQSMAKDEHTGNHGETQDSIHNPVSHDDSAHEDHSPHDRAEAAAGQLVPKPEDIPWFRSVVYAAGGLFAAAVIIGVPALKLRGPEQSEPVDTHDSQGDHH